MLSLATWPGSRLTGYEGTRFLSHFSSEIDLKELSAANEELNSKYHKFEPWMSHQLSRSRFSCLNGDSCLDLSNIDLEKRRVVFSTSDQFNLWNIDPKLNENVTVMQRDNPDFLSFKNSIDQVLAIFEKISESWVLRKNFLVSEIIPIISSSHSYLTRENGAGTSCLLYRKGIFLSLPRNKETRLLELSLNFVHELGHQALMIYEHVDDIVKGDKNQKVFSVIRKIDRPVIQSFHALAATAYMLEYIVDAEQELRLLVGEKYLNLRQNQLYTDFIQGLELIRSIQLTILGKQIFDEFCAFSIWLSGRMQDGR
jgi:hypothetical protein